MRPCTIIRFYTQAIPPSILPRDEMLINLLVMPEKFMWPVKRETLEENRLPNTVI